MSEITTARGSARSGLVLLLVSLLAGVGMAFAAAATIVSTSGPGDGAAVTDGQQQPLPPEELLEYGG
ncbi:MAG: hypothetical protein ACRCY8_02900 [Dermatophilaceae bacterium]